MTAVTNALSILTIISDIIIVLYFLESIGLKLKMIESRSFLFKWVGHRAIFFAFVIALVSMLGSLYFSDILHYEPCRLCWYERIFMYSQVFLFLTAFITKDKREIWKYSLPLSIIGGAISLFHYYIQAAPKPLINIPCSAVGNYSASCSKVFVLTYGYITIPVMALSAFALLIILSISNRKKTT